MNATSNQASALPQSAGATDQQYFDSMVPGFARQPSIPGLTQPPMMSYNSLNPVAGIYSDLNLNRKDSYDSGKLIGSNNLYGKNARVPSETSLQDLNENETQTCCQDLERFARESNSEEVSSLLDQFAAKLPRKSLNTALRAAVKGAVTSKIDQTISIINDLINANANINSEEADQGKTPLMMACEKGYIELVNCILELDALVDSRDHKKKNALFYAIGTQAQNIDVVQELIKKRSDVNLQTVTGMSPLLLAAERGHDRIINELLISGANIKFQGGDNQNSSLHICCLRGHAKSVAVLLQFCQKKFDDSTLQDFLFLKNKRGQIALEIAKQEAERNKDDQNRNKVYELLSEKHRAQDKKREHAVENLLKTQEEPSMDNFQQAPKQQKQKKKNKKSPQQTQAPKPEATVLSDDEEEFKSAESQNEQESDLQQESSAVMPVEQDSIQQQLLRRDSETVTESSEEAPLQIVKQASTKSNKKKRDSGKKQEKTPQKAKKTKEQQSPYTTDEFTVTQPKARVDNFMPPRSEPSNQMKYKDNHDEIPQGTPKVEPIGASAAPSHRVVTQQPLPQQNQQQQQQKQHQPAIPYPNTHMAVNHDFEVLVQPPPFKLKLNLDTQKAQQDFIFEQQDLQIRSLENKLQQMKQQISGLQKELVVSNQNRQELYQIGIAKYKESEVYYKNFKLLEEEYIKVFDHSSSILLEQRDIVSKIKDSVKNPSLVCQIEKVGDMSKKVNDLLDESRHKIDQRRDDGQQQTIKANPSVQQVHQTPHQEQSQMMQRFNAQTKRQPRNLLVEMEQAYEPRDGSLPSFFRSSQEIYGQLHEEVNLFRQSVKHILQEMKPIKDQIVSNISNLIKTSIPNSDVQVYGSHATQLCLHWSDIDLVLVDPARNLQSQNMNVSGNNMSGAPNAQGPQQNMSSGQMYQPKRDYLMTVYEELRKEQHASWITSIQFIQDTVVPVIKLQCAFFPPPGLAQKTPFNLPDEASLKYPDICKKPINIDITAMTDHHNGMECVDLVRKYLEESPVIEPLILVLKQMLKVWGFNDPYTGGLSSYALFLMIVSFLQYKNKPNDLNQIDLGETLLEFMRHYADLDAQNTGIACSLPGQRGERPNCYPTLDLGNFNFMQFRPEILIDDPLNPSNNVGKSSFKFPQIKQIFNMAYNQAFLSTHSLEKSQQQSQSAYYQPYSNNQMLPQAPALMHTQSAPFIHQPSHQPSLSDNILAKLIYGYKQFKSAQDSQFQHSKYPKYQQQYNQVMPNFKPQQPHGLEKYSQVNRVRYGQDDMLYGHQYQEDKQFKHQD